MVFNVNKEGTR